MYGIFLKTCFVAGAFVAQLAAAEPVKVGNLTVSEFWVRPATGGPNTAAYALLENDSQEPDILLKAQCPDADTVELHNHIDENGVMKMRPVENIPIKEAVTMKPGGMHIMLMGIKESFKQKKTVDITLEFEKAGKKTITFPIGIPSAS